MRGNESLGPFTSAPILALVQFGILRAQPRLHGISHVADLLTALLDGSRLTSLDRAAASGSTRLFDRVAQRLQNDPQLPTSVLRHRLARALNVAIERDDLVMVQRIHDLHPEPLDVASLATAFEFGSLETVQWVVGNRCDRRCCPPGIQNLCRLCVLAAQPYSDMRDADRVIPWLLDTNRSFQPKYNSCWQTSMGHIKWLDDRGLLTDTDAKERLTSVIASGPPTREPVLKYLIDIGTSVDECGLVKAMASASTDPQLESILDVVVNSHLCDSFRDKFVFSPIRPGGVSVLQWDVDFIKTVSSSWRGSVYEDLRSSGYHGHLDLVEWLSTLAGLKLEANPIFLPVSDERVLATYQLLHRASSEMDWHRLAREAVCEGRLQVVQWLLAQTSEELPPYWSHMDKAAEYGHTSVLQWLHENNIGLCSSRAMYLAARNGHLEVVQWLHANRSEGCTEEALEEATYYGHLEVVKWLATNRFEGNAMKAMACAAVSGHVEILEWLAKNRDDICVQCVRQGLIQRPFRFYDYERTLNRPIAAKDSLLWMREHATPLASCTGVCLPRAEYENGLPLAVLAVRAGDGPLVRDLVEWHPDECSRTEIAEAAADSGRESLLRWLFESDEEEWDFSLLACAAARRYRQCILEWFLNDFKDRVEWFQVRAAAKRGKHGRLVRWLDANVLESH